MGCNTVIQTPKAYSEFEDSMLAAFPELKERYASKFRRQLAERDKPGPYITIFLVFRPFIHEVLDGDRDGELIRRILAYLEAMAGSPDIQVANLLQVAILENWIRDPKLVHIVWPHMGENTKAAFRSSAKSWKYEHNIPG